MVSAWAQAVAAPMKMAKNATVVRRDNCMQERSVGGVGAPLGAEGVLYELPRTWRAALVRLEECRYLKIRRKSSLRHMRR